MSRCTCNEDVGAKCLHQPRAVRLRDLGRFPPPARDRFGIKPLYYAVVDGTCHIASEVKALTALGAPLRWDRESLFDADYGLMTAPSQTTFDGIFQVPPAATCSPTARTFEVH